VVRKLGRDRFISYSLLHEFSPAWQIRFVLKVEIEKFDCVLSKRATRPYIYGHTNTNAYVLIYV